VLYILSLCVCSLRYPVCNAHAPCCHCWPAPLHNNFPHYLIKGKIFGKKNYWEKCVLIFSTTFVWNFSHSEEKKTERDMINMCTGLQEKNALFLKNFNKSWPFLIYFRKILKYKISWESVQWEMSCSMRVDGHIDGRMDTTTPTVAFRNFAKATNKTEKKFITYKETGSPTKKMAEWGFFRGTVHLSWKEHYLSSNWLFLLVSWTWLVWNICRYSIQKF
jgi:hypothetical protein